MEDQNGSSFTNQKSLKRNLNKMTKLSLK